MKRFRAEALAAVSEFRVSRLVGRWIREGFGEGKRKLLPFSQSLADHPAEDRLDRTIIERCMTVYVCGYFPMRVTSLRDYSVRSMERRAASALRFHSRKFRPACLRKRRIVDSDLTSYSQPR